jgi:homoserine kinase
MPACSVFAPASSANLGPGFDCLALALDRWLRVDIEHTVGDGIVDAGSPALLGGSNLVIDAMHETARRLNLRLPGCAIRVTSDIPVARGLGSSAAAIVAGIRAAGALNGVDITDAVAVDIGGQMEGHADNVSAAVLGGATISILAAAGYRAELLARGLPWAPVVLIPEAPAFTHEAREVVPAAIPVADAVSNVGRAVMLALAFGSGRRELVREAMIDRIHQPYRASIFPHLEPTIAAALEAGAAGACLSGAGPSILALAEPERAAAVAAAMSAAATRLGIAGVAEVLRLPERGSYVVTSNE